MCEPKSATEIASVKRSIKIARSGMTLVVKLPRQSTRPKQKVGKTFSKTRCPIWKVSQGLNGIPDANSPSGAMSHNGRTITDIRSIANVFINHYPRVSKLNMPKSDRDTNRLFNKCLRAPSVDNESCAPLQMNELQYAIKKMKGKGAAGPDDIPPSFLKSL